MLKLKTQVLKLRMATLLLVQQSLVNGGLQVFQVSSFAGHRRWLDISEVFNFSHPVASTHSLCTGS